jgi:hypothetical protein
MFSTFAKATYAVLASALGSLASVLVGPHASFSSITAGQWVAVALAALIAGGGVYGITNRPAAAGGASS